MNCISGKSCYKTVSFRFSNLPELQSGHFPSHVFTTDTCTALFSSIQNKFLFLCYYLIQLPKRYASTMRPAQTTVFCLLHYYKTQFIRLSYVFVQCVIEREREREGGAFCQQQRVSPVLFHPVYVTLRVG